MNSQTRDFLVSIRPPYFDAFYFVDEAGQSSACIQPHVFFKIIFFLEGDVCYAIGDLKHNMIPGDLLITPRFTPYHHYSPTKASHRRLVVWFTEDLLCSLDPTKQLLEFFRAAENNGNGTLLHFPHEISTQIFNHVFTLASERDYERPFGDAVSYALITLVLTSVCRHATATGPTEGETPQSTLCIDDVVQYINENLTQNLSLDIIADHFFISKFHLERLFKKYMGITVHSYIIQRRMTLARQKIYDGISPTKVYMHCGFSSYSTFYRAFRKMYGLTPKEFHDQATALMVYDGSRAWDAPQITRKNP